MDYFKTCCENFVREKFEQFTGVLAFNTNPVIIS